MSTGQVTLEEWACGSPLDELTDAEQEVWAKVENGSFGVRQYARWTDRSPGTVGNLLARARDKLDDEL